MGACLSIEDKSPQPSKKVTRGNQNYSKGAKKRTTHRAPSYKTKAVPYGQRTRTQPDQLSKTVLANDNSHRLLSTPTTRRSTSKPKVAYAAKDNTPVLREVNRGSNLLQHSTHQSFEDSKAKSSNDAFQEIKQPAEQQQQLHDTEQTSSLATPWVSGSLVQQRMSQLFQSNLLRTEHQQNNENISWSGLVKQRQSIFQNNNHSLSETVLKKDTKPIEKGKDSDNMKKNPSMKENATPFMESKDQPVVDSYPFKETVDTSTEWKQETETPSQQYGPHHSHRLPRKKIEETWPEMRDQETLDIEKWRNRRTRRMVRNSVLMEEQEDPEQAAARSMRGSVLRAHSSMKFQF
ncbi:hypothetical protein GpartN1_g3183.t1 [Galdieria partita]|uniref:Uncharacterized protein n=1 Tax=Galdieria partita TaxID=83374 RepID=A0A9C7UQB6_9RHOD|nr:hypothetical protein GpartN1_g3183.t1 [Galdieria partita]